MLFGSAGETDQTGLSLASTLTAVVRLGKAITVGIGSEAGSVL